MICFKWHNPYSVKFLAFFSQSESKVVIHLLQDGGESNPYLIQKKKIFRLCFINDDVYSPKVTNTR